MESKQTQDNTKHTNIRLDIEMYEKIERIAKANQRTVSGQIRFMLEQHLNLIDGNIPTIQANVEDKKKRNAG